MTDKLLCVLLGLGIGSMLLGGICVLCRAYLLGHMRVIWERVLVTGRGVKLMPMLLFYVGYHASSS